MVFRVKDWNTLYEDSRTRELKTLLWVRVPNKTHGLGYSKLVRYPRASMYLGVWLAILQVASKSAIRGDLSHLCESSPEQLTLTAAIQTDVCRGGDAESLIQTGVCRNLSYVTHLSEADFAEAIPVLILLEWLELDPNAATPQEPGTASQEPDAASQGVAGKTPLKGREGKGIEEKATAAWFLTQFWPLYPRKVNRAAALKACLKAVKTPEDRAAALAKIKHDGPEMLTRDEQYRPHGATWFNQGRWSDPIETSPAAEQSLEALPEYMRNKF